MSSTRDRSTSSSSTWRASGPGRSGPLVAGCVAATLAFAAYARTLLPGVDLGDTAGFQAAVLWPEVSARQAYPLYYALAAPFVRAVSPGNPALGLNLFSAVCAAGAVGALTGIVASVTASVAGGMAAGLLLAFSYTFWSQSVIAEVYALHLALVGLCLIALLAYARGPTTPRLAAFFAAYALAFGNHLSSILLAAPFAAFLLMVAPRPRELVRPRTVALAATIAALGALQYLPNLAAVWTSLDAPERWTDRLAAFWFDVTKSDWRESMVLGISPGQIPDRLAMFAFDARQQFGAPGLVLAAVGAAALWRRSRPWSALVLVAYGVNSLFAFTYNVGDPHVFYLPGHFFTALSAGAGIAWAARSAARRSMPLAVLVVSLAGLYVAWRAHDTWPAADRHADRRAQQLVAHMTFGVSERRALLVEQLDWQVENALLYESRYRRRDLAWIRLSDVLLHLPLLVRDNHASGRDVVVTESAAAEIARAYGPLLPLIADPSLPVPSLGAAAQRIPRGAPFVLTILPPPRGEVLDVVALQEALAHLTSGRAPALAGTPYEIVVGRSGEAPLMHRSDLRPRRHRVRLPEGDLEIRMEGWVSIETFRRGGFGHVILDRRHRMAVERGVSLVRLDETAEPVYAAGLYAPRRRFRIPASAPALALLHLRQWRQWPPDAAPAESTQP